MKENCPVAQGIIARNGDICVNKDGECTALYWHLSACEDCAELREKANDDFRKKFFHE